MDDRSTPDPAAAGRPDPAGGGSPADRLWWYRDARQPGPPVLPDRRRVNRREFWGRECSICFAARWMVIFAKQVLAI